MTLKEFEKTVRDVMESLPSEFYPLMENVTVEVAEEPDRELLEQAGFTEEEIQEGDSLLGLFDPMELPSPWSGEAIDTQDMPHTLWIFKNPHEEEFPDPKRLRIEIRKTVIHELAHHFGFTERDLQKFDDNPNPFSKEQD